MAQISAAAGSIDNPIPRRAARVLLIDSTGRVLMFRGFDPARPEQRYWFTAGGGLDEGETPAQAAVRELREETGLSVSESSLEGPVWRQTANFPYDGQWFRQDQDYFVVRVQSWQVSLDGLEAEEQRSIDAHQWWSLAELTGTRERYYPAELPRLLAEILGQ
jgi:8-oxo-dGTP pyrophosphatase MutT (NUDIX family)